MSDAEQRFGEGLAQLGGDVRATFAAAADEHALRAANAKLVGPEGVLTKLFALMPELPGPKRKELGKQANAVRQQIEGAFNERLTQLRAALRKAELENATIDVTEPGRYAHAGKLHPLTRTSRDLVEVFRGIGFDVADGPEIDSRVNNFERLGFPADHPAMDSQDSFFVKRVDGSRDPFLLLRTHTSPVQVRELMRRPPPLAIVCPGVVYRRDDDATHSPMFSQIEGLYVDVNVSFAHLKGVLRAFVTRFFGDDVPLRFRPSYFPFVEPGGEVDVGCTICRGFAKDDGAMARRAQCRVCKGTSFLEILGCGMVHPVVLEACGVDSEQFTGFAFGLGIDRITMLRHGISDIRRLYENDPRFLEQL